MHKKEYKLKCKLSAHIVLGEWCGQSCCKSAIVNLLAKLWNSTSYVNTELTIEGQHGTSCSNVQKLLN